MPGVHHPIFKGRLVNHDPRERFIAEYMARHGRDNVFHAFSRERVQALNAEGASPYAICVNVDAVIARGRAATIAVEDMKFHRPVKVGDEVSLFARFTGTGRSSMQIHVEAWRRSRASDDSAKVTEARFTFVALDAEGRPRQLPQAVG